MATTTATAEELGIKAHRIRAIVSESDALAEEAQRLANEIGEALDARVPYPVRVPFLTAIKDQAQDVAGMLRHEGPADGDFSVIAQEAEDLVALVEAAIGRCDGGGADG